MIDIIDITNLKILHLLSKNSRITIKEISENVLLSEPSVKKRIDVMKDSGIIQSFTTKLNFKKLGYTIVFFTKVSNLSISNKSFLEKVNDIKEFIECYSVTGKDNYILKGIAEDIEQIEIILNQLTSFSSVETSIVLEDIDLTNNLLKG